MDYSRIERGDCVRVYVGGEWVAAFFEYVSKAYSIPMLACTTVNGDSVLVNEGRFWCKSHAFGCTKSRALGGPGTPGACWCESDSLAEHDTNGQA